MNDLFRKFAHRTSGAAGSSWAFVGAVLIVVVWGISGPMFGFSDTWQLVINTGTTIVTFLMVFLIQNTQNRDTAAIQLKLAELIAACQTGLARAAVIAGGTQDITATMTTPSAPASPVSASSPPPSRSLQPSSRA